MHRLLSLFAAAAIVAGAIPAAQAIEGGTLRVVTEGGFPPWNLTAPSGEIVGFDVDVIDVICAELQVECAIEAQTFDAMIPALNDGRYDVIIDALGITAARMEVIDFTVPYAGLCYSFASVTPAVKEALPAEERIEMLTGENLGEVMDMYSTAFEGATIGTLASGTSTRFVNAHLSDVSSRPYRTPAARDLDLKAGRVDVVFASKDSLLALKERENIDALELVGPCLRGDLLGSGGVGIGLRKGDAELKARLDAVIGTLVENGTIRTLSEQHFGIDMSPVGLD